MDIRSALALVLTIACSDTRARPGEDAGVVAMGGFESSILSRDRSASELSAEEAQAFCMEGVRYANDRLTIDQWEHLACLSNVGLNEATQAECETAVAECEASDALRAGYDFASDWMRCAFTAAQTECTVTVRDLEDCWTQYGDSFVALYGTRTCALAGMTREDFHPTLTPGCQAAFDGSCACLLGRQAGSVYCAR